MTFIAIKIYNAVTLKRFWTLEKVYTRVADALVDITVIDHDDEWTYCDVDVDDDEGYMASSRLVDYIKGLEAIHEIVIDWDAMADAASENPEEESE